MRLEAARTTVAEYYSEWQAMENSFMQAINVGRILDWSLVDQALSIFTRLQGGDWWISNPHHLEATLAYVGGYYS